HGLRGGDAHQLAGVAIGGDRVERLSEERLPLEDLDRSHDGEDADRDGELDRSDIDPEDVDGLLRDGGGERAVVASPHVLRHGEEEEPEDDGEEDPSFALLLEGEADPGALDEKAEESAEEKPAHHLKPVGQPERDEGEADEGRRSEEHTSELQSPYDLVC